MPAVTFSRVNKGSIVRDGETILDAARRAGAPVANSCGDTGVCGRCRVEVVEGLGNLSPRTAIERQTAEARSFAPSERLACQALVRGDCTVTTGYW